MTDGVARELEQAEVRLADLVEHTISMVRGEDVFSLLEVLTDAAIEVGRLRALTVTPVDIERAAAALCEHNSAGMVALGDADDRDYWYAAAAVAADALAAREEVQE